jgi:preprotein translocase SecE subunit
MQTDTRAAGSLQLGVQKYLYWGYFVGGCMVAYIVHQGVTKFWGEGHDAIITGVAIVAGIAAVVAGWRNKKLRSLSQEVLDELVAVTWPTRQETYTASVVVIATAFLSALLIFGLDQFWNWFTNYIFK